MEQPISFLSENLELEAIIDRRDAARGVVVTHPHPLYGGDMNNHVVSIICRAYARRGVTTLRFNFRGAGRSQGRYDEGRGEQNDVRAAADFLANSGAGQVDLAGYSFGAWVSALATTAGLQAQRLIMVSPPVAFVDFSTIAALPNLQLVVTGSRDDIAPPALIKRHLQKWRPQLQLNIIDGADHFYQGFGSELEKMLMDRIGTSGGPPIGSPAPAG
jgi:alpha/beta superfamily hydrolase